MLLKFSAKILPERSRPVSCFDLEVVSLLAEGRGPSRWSSIRRHPPETDFLIDLGTVAESTKSRLELNPSRKSI